MPAWKNGTPSTRNMALPATKATPLPITWKPFASTVRRRFIAIPSHQSANQIAGLQEPRKLRYRFSSASHKISAGHSRGYPYVLEDVLELDQAPRDRAFYNGMRNFLYLDSCRAIRREFHGSRCTDFARSHAAHGLEQLGCLR